MVEHPSATNHNRCVEGNSVTTKNSTLTHQKLLELLDYSPETGTFFRKTTVRGRWKAGVAIGNKSSSGHLQIRVGGERYLAHRLAWFYVHKEWPSQSIDHINGVRSDNRIANLRDVSQSVNTQNQRRAQDRTQSKLLGVHFQHTTQKWLAQIGINGKLLHLGSFFTPEEASEAYLKAKRQIHEGCTI